MIFKLLSNWDHKSYSIYIIECVSMLLVITQRILINDFFCVLLSCFFSKTSTIYYIYQKNERRPPQWSCRKFLKGAASYISYYRNEQKICWWFNDIVFLHHIKFHNVICPKKKKKKRFLHKLNSMTFMYYGNITFFFFCEVIILFYLFFKLTL